MRKIVSIILLIAVLAGMSGIGLALTPPPPPPPPVPQNLGVPDSSIDRLQLDSNQSACRVCHQTSGTNTAPFNGTYNNTIGGVPTRHHNLLAEGKINPFTNTPFGCTDCHPSTPGIGNGILLDRVCTDCHSGARFFADAPNPMNAHVGNISRPHHFNTTYDDANIGNPAADRTCNKCHGSFVDNYNDGHYKPTYDTSFMITPYASFKAINSSQLLTMLLFEADNSVATNKAWGGCESCHLGNYNGSMPFPTPVIGNNHDNHHRTILGSTGNVTNNGVNFTLGGATPFNLAGSPWGTRQCFICHVVNTSSATGSPLRFTTAPNPFNNNEVLTNAMELRNSTIENSNDIEFVSINGNISINGTGCEKCHSVQTIHNIEAPAGLPGGAQAGQQGLGHIGNNLDCNGCHNSWLPADVNPFAGPIVPTLDSVTPAVIAPGITTTMTLSGGNFINDVTNSDGTVTHYTSVVTVDGVTYTPTSITDSQIVVNIPALNAGTYQLQIVKGTNTLSKLTTLTVMPIVTISSAKLSGTTLTITGTGLGNIPTTDAQQYVSFDHAGSVYYSDAITSWTDTGIVATLSGSVAAGDKVYVITASSGEAVAAMTAGITPPVAPSITVTSPNGGESWKRGSTHAITWKSANNPGANVKIELLKGTSATTIKSSTANSGSYSWKISSSQSTATNYKIRITSTSNNTYKDTSDNNFQIGK